MQWGDPPLFLSAVGSARKGKAPRSRRALPLCAQARYGPMPRYEPAITNRWLLAFPVAGVRFSRYKPCGSALRS